jgi:hypothetical protein
MFCFESYGVPVAIECDSDEILSRAVATTRSALLERVFEIPFDQAEQRFLLRSNPDASCSVIQNGELMITEDPNDFRFWKFFNGLVRILVAEHAKSVVFVHAGVVGWRGGAIVLPGSSFAGKTTLVADLIRCGAEYYSDEYAVFDETGLVQAFPRKLWLRTSGPFIDEQAISVEELGGRVASSPAPVKSVLFSKFEAEAKWEPEILTPGQGMMEILPQTIAIRQNTEFVIKILKKAIGSAIIVKSPRPDVANFTRAFLEFVDNKAF